MKLSPVHSDLRFKKNILKGVVTLAKWGDWVEGVDVRNLCRGVRDSVGAYHLSRLVAQGAKFYETCQTGALWDKAVTQLIVGVTKCAKWLIRLEWPHLKGMIMPLTLIGSGSGIYREMRGIVKRASGLKGIWIDLCYFTKKISAVALHVICIVGASMGLTLSGPVTLTLTTLALVASVCLFFIKQIAQEESRCQV